MKHIREMRVMIFIFLMPLMLQLFAGFAYLTNGDSVTVHDTGTVSFR